MAGASPKGEDGVPAAASNSPTPADKSVAPAHPHPAAAGEGGHVKAGKWGLVIGAIPLLIGLAIVMPVLGHATWHLYRKVVVPR